MVPIYLRLTTRRILSLRPWVALHGTRGRAYAAHTGIHLRYSSRARWSASRRSPSTLSCVPTELKLLQKKKLPLLPVLLLFLCCWCMIFTFLTDFFYGSCAVYAPPTALPSMAGIYHRRYITNRFQLLTFCHIPGTPQQAQKNKMRWKYGKLTIVLSAVRLVWVCGTAASRRRFLYSPHLVRSIRSV